jgi:hypothetical protein
MIDHLRIHVVWPCGSSEGARVAEMISRHFDGIGMERDGVAYRVPVRFASAPWHPGSLLPRAIDLSRADHNAVVLLHDDFMDEQASEWDQYTQLARAAIEARGDADVYIPFCDYDGSAIPVSDRERNTQYVYRTGWTGLNELARDKRLLLHVLVQIRRHLRKLSGDDRDEPLFVSHAKADGDTAAREIVAHVQSPGHDVPLHTFYDAMELNPGEDFKARFDAEIGRGTLIAIVSDVYDSRPWCVFELTTAKRHRRPIVLADIGGVRVSRTFPYGANLPRVRLDASGSVGSWIDSLLVETMSEGLRCDVFQAQAAKVAAGEADVMVMPRPPELFDVIDADLCPRVILYPDPPLGDIEARLVNRAMAALRSDGELKTLGEYQT